MNQRHDADHETGGAAHPGDRPRVSRDEVRDLTRLRRSRSDRKVAGVAAGIAQHLDIDPLLVRVALVVLSFFGGAGLIVYAAAWIVVPEEGTEETVVRLDEGVRTAVLVIAGALGLAAMIGDSVGGMDIPWPLFVVGLVVLLVFGGKQARHAVGRRPDAASPDTAGSGGDGPRYPGYRPGPPAPPARPADPKRRGPLLFPFTVALAALALGVVGTLHLAGVDVAPSTYPATVLGVVGVMLVVGAFYGRAGGLIFVGLVAAAATALTSVVDRFDVGQIDKTPTSVNDLADGYDLGIGEIKIDLRDLPAKELVKLDQKTLELDVNVGHIRLIVPDDGLQVQANTSIDIGETVLFGGKSSGSDKGTYGEAGEPLLRVEADMVVGQIEILSESEAMQRGAP